MKDETWEELESWCISTIRHYIVDNVINNFMDEDSALALWDKLGQLYIAKSLTNKLHMKRQLYKLKMEGGWNLIDHMSMFNRCMYQLQKIDVKIEEEDKEGITEGHLMVDLREIAGSDLVPKEGRGVHKRRFRICPHDIRSKNTFPSDAWVLDSGCTMHVCSRKDYFDTFHECKDCNLFMGDGYPCKVEGFGTSKIMMYVGVVHAIGDVAYVPKMRKNLG
ncbi:unnamed protein product [Prunus armeniaca]